MREALQSFTNAAMELLILMSITPAQVPVFNFNFFPNYYRLRL